ncbi:DUF1002 domain-containing protein [bacterium]|nr:DUF1002 domain-containing protein [bacterium]MDY3023532.1 DUF1002 domain-containing protein [Oliverpabstia sp.]
MRTKKGIAAFLAAVMIAGGMTVPAKVQADEVDAPYLALGADLTEEEKNTVFGLLGVDAGQLDQYMVVMVTNEDEHKYLDSYLDASVIGSRALSSVVVEKKEKGTGIQVKTSNITYCTTGMYQNALATAGLEDAEIRVAGPFSISGTAALVGAMKAYGEMTGESIEPENADAATEELVMTSELGETLGSQDQAEALIGAVKDAIVADEVTEPEEIEAVIDDTAKEMNIELSEEDREKIRSLMEKIGQLDLDVSSLKAQAKELYQKLDEMNIDISDEQVQGLLSSIASWFGNLWETIKGWLE